MTDRFVTVPDSLELPEDVKVPSARLSDSTAAGRALLDAADAAAQRTALGLGTAATTPATDYATAAQGAKADAGDVAQITLTGNLALTIPEGHPAGQVYRCAITQTTGGHTVTYGGNAVAVETAAGSQTLVEIWPNGEAVVIGAPVAWADVASKPATFAPTAHKTSHATGGADALTPADIGAQPAGSYVPTTRTVAGKALSANVTLTPADVGAAPALGADDNYVTDVEKVKLANLSGTNTGDQDLSGLVVKSANLSDLSNAAAARDALGLGPTGRVLYVADHGNDANHGRTPESAKRTIQAAVDARVAGGTHIYVLPSATDYAPFTIPGGEIVVEGLGGRGQDTQVGKGSVRVAVPSGGTGASLAIGAPVHIFRGVTLRGIHFVGSAGAVAGVDVGNMSNFTLDNVTASDFDANGIGIRITGSTPSQYGTMRDCILSDNHGVSLHVVNHNGLRVFGGLIESLFGGSVVTAGTIGIKVDAASDTFRAYGVVTQFQEIGYDIAGSCALISGARIEGFGTGVKFSGDRGVLGDGCWFTNYIIGGGGRAVHCTATSTRSRISPFDWANVTSGPVVLNEAAVGQTQRTDGSTLRLFLPAVSASGTYTLGFVPAGASCTVGYLRIRHLGVDPGTTYSNRWGVSTNGRAGMIESYTAGWASGATYVLFSEDPTRAFNALAAGTAVTVSLTKTGTPTDLTNLLIEAVLIPY